MNNPAPTPLEKVRAFLLDMDGTIYLGPHVLDGAVDFIAYLRESGRRFLFFTNNPTADATRYSQKLRGMGIEAAPEEVLTSGEATARYLVKETSYRKLFVLGTPSFEQELERAGLTLTDTEPDAVVLSFDKTLTYSKLEKACLFLRDQAPYVATNPDFVCPTEYGYIPDCGAMAALLEKASGRSPQFIGKPNAEMARMGMAKLGAAPEATAMAGDRLYTDMEMAYRASITSVLVLSGESTKADVANAQQRPDYVFASVEELHRRLREADA